MSYALLIDIPECVGCGECQAACQREHNLPVREMTKLTSTNYTYLQKYANDVSVRRMCQHCESPTCVSVCPVGAFEKTKAGPVVYDADKCIGCRYCIMACPFDVPKYEWENTFPQVRKCTMCYHERTSKGRPTACSEACPTGATLFGEKDQLVASALEKMRANPDRYVQKLYGQKDAGGTNVLYLSGMPFEQLGFKTTLGYEPLPMLTWNVLSKLPDVVVTGGMMLYGIWWITGRRAEVLEYERRKGADNGSH